MSEAMYILFSCTLSMSYYDLIVVTYVVSLGQALKVTVSIVEAAGSLAQ